MFDPKLLKTILALSILANILLLLKSRDEHTPPNTAISAFTAQQLENTMDDFTELQLALFNKLNQKELHTLLPAYNTQLKNVDSITNVYLASKTSNRIYQDGESLLQAKLNITKQLADPFDLSSELQDSLLFGYQNTNPNINPTEARLQLLLTRYSAIDYSRRKWNLCGPVSDGENIVKDSTIIVFFPFKSVTNNQSGDSLQIESVILGDEALPVSRCRIYNQEHYPVIIIEAPARLIRNKEVLLIKFKPFIKSSETNPVYANYLLNVAG